MKRFRKNWLRILSVMIITAILMQSTAIAVEIDGEKTIPAVQVFNTTRIIVKYKSYSDRTQAIRKVKLERLDPFLSVQSIESAGLDVVDAGSENRVAALIEDFEALPEVEYVVPDHRVEAYQSADAQTAGGLSVFSSLRPYAEIVSAAWDYGKGESVRIGVLDTGIDTTHTDLAANIQASGRNFIDDTEEVYKDAATDRHGTHVVAVVLDGAPQAQLLPLKFMDNDTGYISDAIRAILYAEQQDVDIVNMSWGCEDYNIALKEVMAQSDILFVCAAGKAGSAGEVYPAAFGLPNVLSVGSVEQNGQISACSDNGNSPDLFAQGSNVVAAAPENKTAVVSGTSFAAARVTAAAAVLKSAVPTLSAGQMKSLLRNSCDTTTAGLPVLNPYSAVQQALPMQLLEDPKFMRMIELSGRMPTVQIADIFSTQSNWAALDTQQKETLCNFYGLDAAELQDCQSQHLELAESVCLSLAAQKAGITAEQALSLKNTYTGDAVYTQLQHLADFVSAAGLTTAEKNEILNLMPKHSVKQIANAYIAAQALDLELSKAIAAEDTAGLNAAAQKADSRKATVQQPLTADTSSMQTVAAFYQVRQDALNAWAAEHQASAKDALKVVRAWQNTHNLFVNESEISPFGLFMQQPTLFNQYKVGLGDYWAYGNAYIDKADGMLQYVQPLLSLAGRNGLDLELALRFDTEAAEFSAAFNDVDAVTYNAATNSVSGALERSAVYANFYDQRYGLGVGVSLNMPQIEILSGNKYLHLPDGEKYKINSDNSLDGYPLQDVVFAAAAGTEFTVNGLSAAWKLTLLDGLQYYFDAAGKYLGCKDRLGDTIQVYYTTDGIVDRIYDTAGRYIRFTRAVDEGETTKLVLVELVDNTSDAPASQMLYTIELRPLASGAWTLRQVTDAAEQIIQFDFDTYTSTVIWNDSARTTYTPGNNTYTGSALRLASVGKPGGLKAYYHYDTVKTYYGPASTKTYPRVNKAYLSVDATEQNARNKQTFSYSAANNLWHYGAASTTFNSAASMTSAVADTIHNRLDTVIASSLLVKEEAAYATENTPAELLNRVLYTYDTGKSIPKEVEQRVYNDAGTNYTFTRTYITADTKGRITEQKAVTGSDGELASPDYNAHVQYVYEGAANANPAIPSKITEYIDKQTVNNVTTEYAAVVHNTFNANGQVTGQKKELWDVTANVQIGSGLGEMQYVYNTAENKPWQLLQTTEIDLIDNPGNADASKNTVNAYTYEEKYGVYTASSSLLNVTDVEGNPLPKPDGSTTTTVTTSATYNMLGQVLSETDPNGNTTSYSYGMVGELEQVTMPDGFIINYWHEYDERVMYAITNQMQYEQWYDAWGNVIEERKKQNSNDPDADYYTVAFYEYDSQNRLVTCTEPSDYNYANLNPEPDYYYNPKSSAAITNYEYDDRSRLVRTTVETAYGKLLRESTAEYETGVLSGKAGDTALYHTVETKVAKGENTHYTVKEYLDSLGQVKYTDSLSDSGTILRSVTNDYGAYGQLLSTFGDVLPQSYAYSYGVNTDGSANANTARIGFSTVFGYSTSEIKATQISENGRVRYELDPVQNAADKNAAEYVYDKLGRVVKQRTPFEENAAGEMQMAETLYYYDAAGNVVEEKVRTGAVESTGTPAYRETRYRYDSMNRNTAVERVVSDTKSIFTQYWYNNEGQLQYVYSGQEALLEFDSYGEVTTTGQTYKTVTYAYDEWGYLNNYDNGINSMEYINDPLTGNAIEILNEDSLQIFLDYDSLGVLSSISAFGNDGSVDQFFTYNLAGQLIQAREYSSQGKYQVAYTYDAATGVLAEESYDFTVPGHTPVTGEYLYTKQYAYNAKGENTGFSLYKGDTLLQNRTYTYNAQGLPQTVTQGDMHVVYSYDVNGNLLTKTSSKLLSNGGMQSVYTYNAGNTVKTAEYKNLNVQPPANNWILDEDYTYTLDGLLTHKTTTTSGQILETGYWYDNLGRTTSVSLSQPYEYVDFDRDETYRYDNWDNITYKYEADWVEGWETYTDYYYNEANQLTEQCVYLWEEIDGYYEKVDEYCTFASYDESGNMTYDGKKSYRYDALGRLTRTSGGGYGERTYTYNTDGELVSSTNAEDTYTYHTENGRISYREALAGGDIPYVLGLQVEGQGMSDYFYDGQGTIIEMMGVESNFLYGDPSEYSAYGKRANDTLMIDRGYKSYMEIDGLYFLGARWYNPEIMRFTQEDSNHGDNYAMNFYSYCGGDPVNYYDPTGYYKQKNGSWWYDYEHGDRPVIGNGQLFSMYNYGYVEDPDGSKRNIFWTHRDEKGKDHVYWNYGEVPYELQKRAEKDLGGLYDQFVDEEILEITNQDMIFIDSAVINGLSYSEAIDSLKVLREGNGITERQLNEITGSGGAGAELLELSYRLGQQNMNLAQTAYLMDSQTFASFNQALMAYAAWAVVSGPTTVVVACFVAGTQIAAEDGQKPIEEIEAGDQVWAQDPETGETALKKVARTFVNETKELVHVVAGGEEIITTPEHPFYVPKKGWTSAAALRAGDQLVALNGELVTVEQVQHELLETPVKVYNFEVEDFHTYFVGDAPVLVHNMCKIKSTVARGVGGKGWVGDKTWRNNVASVGKGGTIFSLNGGIPSKAQAIQLINESGGRVVRIEGPHSYPNPHTYSHINYITSSGIKGTIQFFE